MSFYAWRPYVPVAKRRQRAQRELAKLKNRAAPVIIAGRQIAASFWGKSWCTNLERYSDYDNRLPRGRTYVRTGAVVDLQITKGAIAAMVVGSSLYKISIAIAPVKSSRWRAICRDCAGTVDSLVELLQGRLAKSVMERVCRKGDGLFPSPDELELSCSCPDWADMCKHVAAVLYGVGARLDQEPQLLFVLRGVNESDLLAGAERDLPLKTTVPKSANRLDERDIAALFGLDMAASKGRQASATAANGRPRSSKTSNNNAADKNPAKDSTRRQAARGRQRPNPGKPPTPATADASRDAAATARPGRATGVPARNRRRRRRPQTPV